MTKKNFDAVKMVRLIRDAHYDEMKHMTGEERLVYYQEKSRQARKNLEQLAQGIGKNQGEL